MTKKQYLQPKMLVSDILPYAMMQAGSPAGGGELGIGGGADPGGAL